MKTNIVVDISPPVPYLAKFWFSSYEPKCCQPIKLQNSLKSNISRKKWMINVISSTSLILSFWVCVIRHTQNIKSKKFAYLCNVLRKACWMKLIFCVQINTKVLYKLIVSLWLCIARQAQGAQNKFTTSL